MNGAPSGAVRESSTTGVSPGSSTGVAPRHLDARRLRMYRGSFWLFILAESFGFLALFAIRYVLVGTGHPAELNTAIGAAITLSLLASGVSAAMALRSIRASDGQAMVFRLDVALGFGLTALWFVVADVSSSSLGAASRFGGIYFATVAFHTIHIVVGLLFLAALRTSGRRGRFSTGDHWLVEAGVRFWLFVVAAWLALFVVFFWS